MNPIREVSCETVTETVRKLFIEANTVLGEDILEAVNRACAAEESYIARLALEQICENARIAREEVVALCQDTGLAVVFAEVGQDVHIVGGSFGVRFRREFGGLTARVTSENPSATP
jgi:fumarate hydratase subunit alpha